jgi:hypothetical protein
VQDLFENGMCQLRTWNTTVAVWAMQFEVMLHAVTRYTEMNSKGRKMYVRLSKRGK